MSNAEVSQPIDNYEFCATNDTRSQLSDFVGKRVILYFYPKDNTPVCKQESKEFRDHIDEFTALNCVIFGISRDSIQSHEKFKEKCGLPFELISDPNEELCRYFDVIKEKNMFGKKVLGIERSTFLIDEHGKLAKEWRKVKVANHISDVLKAVRKL